MPIDPSGEPLTAAAAGRALRKGKLTSVAFVEDCLRRIAAHDGHLHSFVLVDEDNALRAARTADATMKRGRRLGPLHGIPFALKDNYGTAGIRTTAHSRLLLDNVPRVDSAVARRLKDAGAILIGKLATHEFAIGGPAHDLPFPLARNPWNAERFAGGSSSGSAVAVAAGLVPLAMGTDTIGSIRDPAGYCGIAGFKSTYGLVPRTGVIPLAYSLDHCGPMCRSVEDCAMVLDAVAGHDPLDPDSIDRRYHRTRAQLRKGIAGMRIGVACDLQTRNPDLDPETHKAIGAALEILKGLGAKLVAVELPKLEDWDACCLIILYGEAYAIHERDLKERPDQYAMITRARLLTGEKLTAADYIQALRLRREVRRRYASAMLGLDAIVTASTMAPAPPVDDLIGPPYFRARDRLEGALFNLVGAPALSVCCGFSIDGLPLSLQIAGIPFADATVLRIGHTYEQATPWHERRPVLV